MAGVTPIGLPFPTGSDLVRDGDNAMQALAEAVDALLQGAGGRVERSATGDSTFTNAGADTILGSGVVPLPAGRYIVRGEAVLYSSGAAPGYAVGVVGANAVRMRHDINTGGANPVPAQVWFAFDHLGGDIEIAIGYRRINATNTLTAVGRSGGISFIQAVRVSAAAIAPGGGVGLRTVVPEESPLEPFDPGDAVYLD